MRNPFFPQYLNQPLVLSGSDESQQRPSQLNDDFLNDNFRPNDDFQPNYNFQPNDHFQSTGNLQPNDHFQLNDNLRPNGNFQLSDNFQLNDEYIRRPEPQPSSLPGPQVPLGHNSLASQRPWPPFRDPTLDIPGTVSASRQPSHERSPSPKMPLSPDEELAKMFDFASAPLDTPYGWDGMPLSNMDDRPNTNSLPRYPDGHQSQRTGDLFLTSGDSTQNFGHQEDITIGLNNQGLDLSDRLPSSLAGTVGTSEIDRGSPHPIPFPGTTGISHVDRGGPLPIPLADGNMAINLIRQRSPPPFPPRSGYRSHHLNQLSLVSMAPGLPNVIAEGNPYFGLYSERQRR